ncbi:hypothetical protein U3516DRAFT_782670 [Neocallimastix sp. 'constans']
MKQNNTDKNRSSSCSGSNDDNISSSSIEITNMEQFNAITVKQAKKLKCVTFRGMEINGQFVDKFGELFYDDLDTLKFHNCVLESGMNYHTLFAGTYTLRHLEIKSRDLTDDDAVETFCCIYPWLLKSVVFSSDNLNRELVMEKLRQCSALSPDDVLSF